MREIAPHTKSTGFKLWPRSLSGEPVRFESQAAQLHRWYDAYAFRAGKSSRQKSRHLFNDITERSRLNKRCGEARVIWRKPKGSRIRGVGLASADEKPCIFPKSGIAYMALIQTGHAGLERALQRVHPQDRANWQAQSIEQSMKVRLPGRIPISFRTARSNTSTPVAIQS